MIAIRFMEKTLYAMNEQIQTASAVFLYAFCLTLHIRCVTLPLEVMNVVCRFWVQIAGRSAAVLASTSEASKNNGEPLLGDACSGRHEKRKQEYGGSSKWKI